MQGMFEKKKKIDKAIVEKVMEGHVISKAELIGLYER